MLPFWIRILDDKSIWGASKIAFQLLSLITLWRVVRVNERILLGEPCWLKCILGRPLRFCFIFCARMEASPDSIPLSLLYLNGQAVPKARQSNRPILLWNGRFSEAVFKLSVAGARHSIVAAKKQAGWGGGSQQRVKMNHYSMPNLTPSMEPLWR